MSENKGKTFRGSIARSLRATAIGALSLLFQGVAAPGAPVELFVERARQRVREDEPGAPTTAQLVMEPVRHSETLFAGHSSHRSHRSHGSHSSHSSGGGSWSPSPSPAYVPVPVEKPKPVVIPRKTMLKVTATPQARVFVDGTLIGTTPTASFEVQGTTVEIQLEHRLLGTVRRQVTVEAGKDNSVDLSW